MMSTMVPLAKPDHAAAGGMTRASTATAMANSDAVRIGSAPATTAKIAAANSAKRCHGAAVRPLGTGVNQSPTASARLAMRATHGERVACTPGAAGATGPLIAAIPCDTCR